MSGSNHQYDELGAVDTIDITHEFGHMLGSKEEYFWTARISARRASWRKRAEQSGDGAVARHFDLIGTEAGVDRRRHHAQSRAWAAC